MAAINSRMRWILVSLYFISTMHNYNIHKQLLVHKDDNTEYLYNKDSEGGLNDSIKCSILNETSKPPLDIFSNISAYIKRA